MGNKLNLAYIDNYAKSIGGKLGKNDNYDNNMQKLEFLCAKCGKPYLCNFAKFQDRCKIYCNDCSLIEKGINRRHDFEFVKNIYKEHGYVILDSEYTNCEVPIKCMDKEGYIGYIHLENIKSGYGIGRFKCMNPSYLYNLNHFCEINDYDCEVLDWNTDKKRKKQTIKIKCSCGNIYETLVPSLLYQKCFRCTECSKKKSRYALKVSKFLDSLNLTYIEEKAFDDCRNILPLPFDFCVLLNGTFFLIEVDGEYHFEPINGEKALQSQLKRDEIKTNYCQYNKISLIRIPYWEIDGNEFKNKIITEVNRQNQAML